MECIRQLLLRCGEALFLLQLLSQHLLVRLIQSFDTNTRQAVVQLTFHQLVCSEDGDRLATRLISALMEVIKTFFCLQSPCVSCFTNLKSISDHDPQSLGSGLPSLLPFYLSFSCFFPGGHFFS